ncbi:hypothetical protein B0H15DRAFT_806799 [Mycena belliarum]|uniref:Uncharacterized protein n=1 Tax=Mycena belliarum TaxID=1033014 RepID=A0AAD6XEG3_9AGAR|nr:hypothetical protein B0H15DRAFT_806799 [Mycena belliae]
MGGPMLPWDVPHVPFVYVQNNVVEIGLGYSKNNGWWDIPQYKNSPKLGQKSAHFRANLHPAAFPTAPTAAAPLALVAAAPGPSRCAGQWVSCIPPPVSHLIALPSRVRCCGPPLDVPPLVGLVRPRAWLYALLYLPMLILSKRNDPVHRVAFPLRFRLARHVSAAFTAQWTRLCRAPAPAKPKI